jgi:hypothetical protein
MGRITREAQRAHRQKTGAGDDFWRKLRQESKGGVIGCILPPVVGTDAMYDWLEERLADPAMRLFCAQLDLFLERARSGNAACLICEELIECSAARSTLARIGGIHAVCDSPTKLRGFFVCAPCHNRLPDKQLAEAVRLKTSLMTRALVTPLPEGSA